jgi:hypothetical protein
MITVDKWKDLPKALRRMVKCLIAKVNFYAGNGLQKNGHDDISNRTQRLLNWAGETIHGHDRTDQRKSGSPTRKTVAAMADNNTENENGDDLRYGPQRKNIMDKGLMRTTRKGTDKNTNEMNKLDKKWQTEQEWYIEEKREQHKKSNDAKWWNRLHNVSFPLRTPRRRRRMDGNAALPSRIAGRE